jgi:hypothetical protein
MVSTVTEDAFTFQLGPRDRIRYHHVIERGRVLEFTVQYEAYINDEWNPVVRYDTAHGFAHRDLMHPDGQVDKRKLAARDDLNGAYTGAAADLRKNWLRYREQYERELSRWKRK